MQLRRGCTREPETYESTQASCEHRQASRVGSTGRSFRGLVSHGPGSSRASPCEMFDTLACTGYDADAAVVLLEARGRRDDLDVVGQRLGAAPV